MIKFRTGSLARALAVGLVFTLYLAPGLGGVAAFAAKEQPKAQPVLTLAVLPFDKTAQGGSDTLGTDLAAAVKASLEATGKFYVIGFSQRLPSIQRAMSERAISEKDAEGPFSEDKALIARVGKAMGAEAALAGSIQQINIDAANGVAEISANIQLVDTQSGEALNTIAVQGKNPTKPEGAAETELVSLAAGDVAGKIAAEVAKESKLTSLQATATAAVPEKPAKKSKTMKYLLLAILLGLGIALAGGGGGSNGTSPEPPPPPP